MPREEERFLVNDIEEFGVKFGDKIIGTLIRSLIGYHFQGPHVATPLLKGHWYEVLSYSVTVSKMFVFTAATAIAFIVQKSLSRAAMIESCEKES